MFVSWVVDERPRWHVRLTYELYGDQLHGRKDGVRLEASLVATGRVRGAQVRLAGGSAVLSLLVKAVDDVDATAAALAIVDSAARDAGLPVLGQLTQRAVRPVRWGG